MAGNKNSGRKSIGMEKLRNNVLLESYQVTHEGLTTNQLKFKEKVDFAGKFVGKDISSHVKLKSEINGLLKVEIDLSGKVEKALKATKGEIVLKAGDA